MEVHEMELPPPSPATEISDAYGIQEWTKRS
jgi:hypothetical protein